MKAWVTLILLSFCYTLYSQQSAIILESTVPLGKEVASSASNTSIEGSVKMNWMVGSSMITLTAKTKSTDLNDGIISTGIYKIYPNPTKDRLIISLKAEFKTEKPILYELYDLYGRKVINKSSFNFKKEVDVSHLPSATYLLKLFNQENLTQKEFTIIKQ